MRRSAFIADLAHVLYDTVEYGAASGVSYAEFARADLEYKVSEKYGNAYALAAHACMRKVRDYMRAYRPEVPESEVKYVFDRGDEGKGHVIRLAEEDGFEVPSFERSWPPSDGGSAFAVQLQAADFAAYEAFRAAKRFEEFGTSLSVDELRLTTQLLTKIPHTWAVLPGAGFRESVEMLGVSRRD